MADRSVLVRIRGDANDLIRAAAAGKAAISGLRNEIDTTNNRTTWLAQGFMALAPALAPLGGAAVPLLAGLATQMTVAGGAATAAVLAFNGVGDALKALNDYQLEPTAEHFTKLQQAMDKIGPAGEEFVRFLDSVGPKFTELQMAAREGMFPGMEEGITHLLDVLPQFERIISNISQGMGELAADAGEGLSGEGFAEFFNYLESDAKPILIDMGQTAGNFAEGLANMLVAFAPMSEGFSTGFRDMSESFANWSHGFDETTGFAEFADYVDQAGPMVLDLIESLAGAFVQIVEAAAPVGNVMVPALARLLDVIGALADTPLGTMFIAAAAGIGVYGRAVALAEITTGGLGRSLFGLEKGFGATLKGADGAIAKMGAIRQTAGLAAGGLGILALSMTDLDEKAGVSNMAMGAMIGTMISPGWGTAIGAGIGGVRDLAAANDDLEDAILRANQALDSMSTDALRRSREDLQSLLAQGRQDDNAMNLLSIDPSDKIDYVAAKWSELSGATAEAEDRLHDVNAALRENGDIGSLLAGPLGETSEAFHRAAESAEEFSRSVASAFGILDRRASLRAARESLRDFSKALKDAPDDMREGGAAYDKVEEALDNIARSSLEAAEHLKGMARVRYLDQMRDQFVAAARGMGLTGRQARALADDLGLLDKADANPKIGGDNKPLRGKLNESEFWLTSYGKKHSESTLGADNSPARGKINEASQWMTIFGGRRADGTIGANANPWWDVVGQINSYTIPDKWVTVRTVNRSGMGPQANAEGGTISGQRLPYGDKVLSWLAPGEEVISNRHGQADRHRELLKAINANAYSGGGTVAHRQAASSSSTRIIERIVERLPSEFRVATDLGDLVLTAVDDRIGDHDAHNARQAATMWSGVTSD